MGKIIAIANQKGGVGKTTTAVNLGASLADAAKRTLIVDMDPQGNSTTGFGVDPRSLNKSIYDVMLENCFVTEALCATEMPSLFLLPANRDLVSAEIHMIDMENRIGRLRQALETVRYRFDYILLDCWDRLYPEIIPHVIPLLREGGLMTTDNVDVNDEHSRHFRSLLMAYDEIETKNVPIGLGGLEVSTKRTPG